MATIKELRDERRSINAQIEALRAKALAVSEKIREAEGPIPDRAGRTTRIGFRIVKP